MNKYGFYIKRVKLDGSKTHTADVEFFKGLNVIYGPSEKGKTYIYQCIEYLFGSSVKPKDIPEAKSFHEIIITIKTYTGKYHTFTRSLSGGNVSLYENQKDKTTFTRSLEVDNKKSKETISDYLLKLCNLKDKKIRKNAEGSLQKLYFQDLFAFLMINEEKIITDKSPIAQLTTREHINTKITFQKNRFRFLVTGKDDSAIKIPLKKNMLNNKKGRLEVLNELIADYEDQIIGDVDLLTIDEELNVLENRITSLNNDICDVKTVIEEHNKEKNIIYSNIIQLEKRINTLNEIFKRTEILGKHYISDISRLRATIEAGQAFDSITNIDCPVCESVIEKSDSDTINQVITSSIIEIKKIEALQSELEYTNKNFIIEKDSLNKELLENRDKYDKVQTIIENEYKNSISKITDEIKNYTDRKEQLHKSKLILSQIDEFIKQRNKIENLLDDNKTIDKTTYDKLEAKHLQSICEILHSILKELKFNNLGDNVIFSEELLDFIIARKNRKDYGKGFRAVIYGCFIVALMLDYRTKEFNIGFNIIDSPLNPYKPDEDRTDEIPINLANNFYKYLYTHITDQQSIIIENTKVPNGIINNINMIKFSADNGFIRPVNKD